MGDKLKCSICGYELNGLKCRLCGAVYPQTTRDSFEFYNTFYDNTFIQLSYLKRMRVYEIILNRILKVDRSNKTMNFLDIGASVGISIVLFKQYGKAVGIELDIPQLRKWHNFPGIESSMIYVNKNDNAVNFYTRLATELSEEFDFIFLIDTYRCIPVPTLIDIVSKYLKKNGRIIIKEVNPDNKSIFNERISGTHSDIIMYSPETIKYLAKRNKFDINWYIISSAIDNIALRIPFCFLKILRPPAYVAELRKGV